VTSDGGILLEQPAGTDSTSDTAIWIARDRITTITVTYRCTGEPPHDQSATDGTRR
jgi:hypothetical protein